MLLINHPDLVAELTKERQLELRRQAAREWLLCQTRSMNSQWSSLLIRLFSSATRRLIDR
jgi:hypothetical protein